MIEVFNEGTQQWEELGEGEEPNLGDRVRVTEGDNVIEKIWRVPSELDLLLYLFAVKRRGVHQIAGDLIAIVDRDVAQEELRQWPLLVAEVEAYQLDNMDIGPILTARQTAGTAIADIVTEVSADIANRYQLVAEVDAARRTHLTALQAYFDAPNLAGLKAYDVTAGWPA